MICGPSWAESLADKPRKRKFWQVGQFLHALTARDDQHIHFATRLRQSKHGPLFLDGVIMV
jgi:hypothetical protein